ncbi:hypothetical protein BDQ12DRAFT_326465 [Crucibulum laeve]|uniref:DUF6533 domain-containing protein n=1 Tax=Crucibulum laeve TaxID=68775 RepID=A0A5C3LPE9_9AGAR|nr:hypothetical protein BDQ12DRAFT_326465 [Crucibulum laeve]
MLLDAGVILSLQRFQIVTYVRVGGTALVFVDWLLTLDDEVTYIWSSTGNFGKTLYFLTRYPAFIDSTLSVYHQVAYSLSAEECALHMRITGVMVMFGILISELILTIRVWALYDRSRKITVFLVLFSVISLAASAVGFIFSGRAETFTAMKDISSSVPGCYPHDITNAIFIAPVILTVGLSVIFALTMVKALQYHKKGTTSFLRVFFCGGIIYFAVLQAISIGNWMIFFLHIEEYTFLLTNLQRSMHSILSARILLDMRREAAKTTTAGCTFDDSDEYPVASAADRRANVGNSLEHDVFRDEC